MVISITGKQLKTALENGVSQVRASVTAALCVQPGHLIPWRRVQWGGCSHPCPRQCR